MRVRLPPKALVCDAGKRPSLQNGPRGPSLRNLKVPCFSLLCESRRFESSGGSFVKWVLIWNGNSARKGRCGSSRLSPGTARRAWRSGTSEVVGISEIDRWAVRAYMAVHGETPNYGDVTRIRWEDVPDFDLLTWSSPCQDFSNAGLGKGGEEGSGTRSSLLWEVRNAIAAKRPRYILFENVKGFVSGKNVGEYKKLYSYLSGEGYSVFAQVLNAKNYGIPQNRERVYIVAILGDAWFTFPQPVELRTRMEDLVEDKADEKYYLDREKVEKWLESMPEDEFLKLVRGI